MVVARMTKRNRGPRHARRTGRRPSCRTPPTTRWGISMEGEPDDRSEATRRGRVVSSPGKCGSPCRRPMRASSETA